MAHNLFCAYAGSSYALAWSTSVAEVDSYFPLDQRAMAQGILAGLFLGLGYGLGCILGGIIFNDYGAIALCYGSIGVAAVSLVVFTIGRHL